MKMRSRYTTINGEFLHECIGGAGQFVMVDSSGNFTFSPDGEGPTPAARPGGMDGDAQGRAIFPKTPGLRPTSGQPDPSRMQFDADSRLTCGIYQPIPLAASGAPQFFTLSDLEDTEPWQ